MASDAGQAFDWNALLDTLRADYPMLYRTWFDDLPPALLHRGELLISARDAARAHYLRENCSAALAQTAMALTGHLISIRVVQSDPGPGWTPTARLTQIPLNPDHTFGEFVVGPANRLAHAAGRAVCNQPGTLYNPLFIHGGSGLGKTHLLQAVCSALRSADPTSEILYVSCDTLVNDYVRAIELGELSAFRDQVRQADALLIDDVQFLANRESSQEEVFHTFNALYQARRQIILSADASPTQIPTLEDRLVSRFNWGLVAQIDPPNREMRQAILQKKARLRGCEIPADVLDYIAGHVDSNIRVLEGALTKLITESQISGKPLTINVARETLPGFIPQPARPLQLSDILQAVSVHFGIRLQELLGRRRTRSISYPRHVAMYLARKLTSLSLEEIGMHFDGRDHSTILHAEQTIESARASDSEIAETLNLLTRQLYNRP